ncbi:MAG: NAD(+) synthase, partial [Prevotella sp.]|nr:NAD(+) synthase [Prevotella sp.]
MYNGFSTVAAVIPGVFVADPHSNAQSIKEVVAQAAKNGAEIIVTPELSITGYSCQDLFNNDFLLHEAENALDDLLTFSLSMRSIIIVGMPIDVCGSLVNAAVVIQKGNILGVVAKSFLPNYGEFYEKRWFTSILDINETTITLCMQKVTVTPRPQIFQTPDGLRFGIEICEDVWAPVPPSCHLALAGADIIFNLSA